MNMWLPVAIDSPCKGCYNLREQNFCSDSEKDFYNPLKKVSLNNLLSDTFPFYPIWFNVYKYVFKIIAEITKIPEFP